MTAPIPAALLALALVYPLLVQSLPVYQRLGALVLLAAIGASAWNIVGGYAGQVSVGHAVFFGFGAYASVVVYTHLGWPPIAGAPVGMAGVGAAGLVVGVPTLRLSGHYFSMATIAGGELVRVCRDQRFPGGAQGLGGRRCRAACSTSRSCGGAVLLYLPRRAGGAARADLGDRARPDGLLPARHQGQRARRTPARRSAGRYKLTPTC